MRFCGLLHNDKYLEMVELCGDCEQILLVSLLQLHDDSLLKYCPDIRHCAWRRHSHCLKWEEKYIVFVRILSQLATSQRICVHCALVCTLLLYYALVCTCCLYLLNNSSLKMKNDFWCISWILISFVTLFSYMFLTFWLMFSVFLKFLKAFLNVSIHLFPKCCSLPEILCFFYFPWDMAEKASSSTNFALSAQLFSSFPFSTFYGNI